MRIMTFLPLKSSIFNWGWGALLASVFSERTLKRKKAPVPSTRERNEDDVIACFHPASFTAYRIGTERDLKIVSVTHKSLWQ
jgi:hypothetical protein